MKKNVFSYFSLLLIGSVFLSCKKETASQPSNDQPATKSVKFEITGNYSGQLFVVYNDNVSGNTTLTVTALPWSKEVNYPPTVQGVGIGCNGVVQYPGTPGQTANMRIYNGLSVVKSASAIAGTNGLVNLPSIAYTF